MPVPGGRLELRDQVYNRVASRESEILTPLKRCRIPDWQSRKERCPMITELTRRSMLAGSVGLAGAVRLAGLPANPPVRPSYFHVSQSTINYQAEFNSGK